jgi:hypothetical protein
MSDHDKREVELWDSVCQSAVFFPAIDPAIANLKRMRRFDAFLQRNGQDAVFCDMAEEDALVAGNQFAKFLYTQFSPADANALMNGEKTLESLARH